MKSSAGSPGGNDQRGEDLRQKIRPAGDEAHPCEVGNGDHGQQRDFANAPGAADPAADEGVGEFDLDDQERVDERIGQQVVDPVGQDGVADRDEEKTCECIEDEVRAEPQVFVPRGL